MEPEFKQLVENIGARFRAKLGAEYDKLPQGTVNRCLRKVALHSFRAGVGLPTDDADLKDNLVALDQFKVGGSIGAAKVMREAAEETFEDIFGAVKKLLKGLL